MKPLCISRAGANPLAGLILPLLLAQAVTILSASAARHPASGAELYWQENTGVGWNAPWASLNLDRNANQRGPILRFLKAQKEVALNEPVVELSTADRLNLRYEVMIPDGSRLVVTRQLRLEHGKGDLALVETFVLKPAKPITQDLEIVRPFSVGTRDAATADALTCTQPLKNGWARSLAVSETAANTEYRLGHWIGSNGVPELALPIVEVNASNEWQFAVCADPRFSALFTLTRDPNGLSGSVRYRYAGSKVPLVEAETRTFGFWLRPAPAGNEPFGKSLDAFFRLMLPDVPPGPRWLQEIYMVGYDFLSDDGRGWEQDVSLLASWLKPAERSHVALCLHGWYDALGSYSFDETAGRLKNEWVAMARTRKVSFTPEELRRRLRFARDRGFRTLLYFADGLAADSGVPGYHDAWAFRDGKGNKTTGWQGPDTFGTTYMMNPAHPEVRRHFLAYMDALLSAVGRDVDGFVWDETFHARAGQIASQPVPAYCDRAMLDLVKDLTARVEKFDRRKVFLASDCVGIMPNIPGYAMVADGTYQDTHCNPARWPDALFPNWRNAYWSCNWGPVSHFHWTRFGVEEFGAPVAISNGWEEDHGPHEWTPTERDDFLGLFRKRMARGPTHVRYLTEDPAKLLRERGPDNGLAPSETIPPVGAGEINWALASNGSQARASSENSSPEKRYPASGAIDGVAGEDGWGGGHGWASANGTALPQWLEVDFPQPRAVSRFIVTTYQSPNESARRWGVVNYRIETWDDSAQGWKPIVEENRGNILLTRVHPLPQPVTTRKFRVVVTRVAPQAGGVARLLQVEAWGKRP